jgi:hypothetical protein
MFQRFLMVEYTRRDPRLSQVTNWGRKIGEGESEIIDYGSVLLQNLERKRSQDDNFHTNMYINKEQF